MRVTVMVQHCALRFEMWHSAIRSGLAQLDKVSVNQEFEGLVPIYRPKRETFV